MMRNFIIALFLLVIFLMASPGLGEKEKLSFVSVKISPMERDVAHRFARMDITGIDHKGGYLEGIAGQSAIQEYKQAGYTVESLIPDMDAFYQHLLNTNYFARFHNYQQMLEEMQQIVTEHPDIAMLQDIGDSYDKVVGRGGYDIWALKISDQVMTEDSTEADVLFGANIHAREIITPEIVLTFMHYLVDHYSDDPWVYHLVNNREIWLIPSINPDGHEYVLTGDYYGSRLTDNPLMWRKNMSDNNENKLFDPSGDGVDLNRNFSYNWGYDDNGSSSDISDNQFRGYAPFSEPETRVLRDFVEQHQFVISVLYHSYSQLWLYPWEYAPINPPEADLSTFKILADSCVAYNGYLPGNSASKAIYLVNGGADDWLYGEKHIFAFTPEVGSRAQGMFSPDTAFITVQIAENLGPNLYMTYAAGEEPIIKDKSFKNYKMPGNYYTVIAAIKPPVRLTRAVPLDTASCRVLYRYNRSTNFDTVALLKEPALDLFTADIPGADSVYVIHYCLIVPDSLGRTGFYPRGAPLATDSLLIDISNTAGIQENANHTVRSFVLSQNYPNPFNAKTSISFSITEASQVSLVVVNQLGQQVKEMTNNIFSPGKHRVVWDGTDMVNQPVSSGIYFYVLRSGDRQLTQKMLLLR